MTDRNIDTSNIGGDLWPIGFDVDIALEAAEKSSLVNLNQNLLQNVPHPPSTNEYADMHHMFFNKFEDLSERTISQITDLTNSLPKNDVHLNQIVYNKFPCPDIGDSHNIAVQKSINCPPDILDHAHQQQLLDIEKQSYSIDIFGKVIFRHGKLMLQLKNFQVPSSFSGNIEECWICKEKIMVPLNVDSHKHSLQCTFQINNDYVQIDINQYLEPQIIPDPQTADMLKLPLSRLDLNHFHTNDPYQPFANTMTTQADSNHGSRFCEPNHVKSKTSSQIGKSIDEISFTPSLVAHSMNDQQFGNNSFINANLNNFDFNHQTGPDSSSVVDSNSPYILPNIPSTDHLINSSQQCPSTNTNLYCTIDKQMNPNQQVAEVCSANPVVQKTLDNQPEKSGKVTEKRCVEVGARKRKSKVAHKKLRVIKMKSDLIETVTTDDEPQRNNILLNTVAKTSIVDSENPKPVLKSFKSGNNCDSSSKADSPKKKFRLNCYICQQLCKSERGYIDHMTTHPVNKDEMYSCSDCSKKFENLKNYILHRKVHKQKILCKICGQQFSRQDKLDRHTDSIHHFKKPHKCHICPKAFSRREYLKSHLNIHWGDKLACDICGNLFSSKHNLSMHKKLHLNIKSHKCNLCDKSFLRRDFLETHVNRDHNNKKLKCEICLKNFSRNDVLRRHKLVHDESRVKFTCHLCKRTYSRKHLLNTHIKTHENVTVLRCNLCPATFKKKQILHKHIKIHSAKEQCNICYKFIPTHQRLQNHLQWHEKQLKLKFEREYFGTVKCDSCPKSFASQQLLNRHVTRSHKPSLEPLGQVTENLIEREKKFFCEHCSKGFTRSCNLKAHMKTHNKPSEDEEILDELPSVLHASKAKKTSHVDKESKYFRLENNTSKFGEISHLSSSVFPTPLEDLPNYPYQITTNENSNNSYLNTGSPNSPLNLSAEAITAAAYLLAYPSYPGPYH